MLKTTHHDLKIDPRDIGTHSMGKTFAQNALGHHQITTTIRYLSVKDKQVDEIIHQLV